MQPIVEEGVIRRNSEGNLEYTCDDFAVELYRYSDPDRTSLADSAAIYLGKEDRDNIRRPLSIMRLDHALEIFRGEQAVFKFYGVSKQVYDHLVTYKTMNMRVAGGNRALVSETFTMPTDRMKDPDAVRAAIQSSMDNYSQLIKSGETKQVARSAMPINADMNPFKLAFNFQTLIESLFVQRIWEPGAQGNTVRVVRAMFALCHQVDPELWETVYELYGPHTKSWKKAQRSLRKTNPTLAQFVAAAREKFGEQAERYGVEELIRALYGQQKTMW